MAAKPKQKTDILSEEKKKKPPVRGRIAFRRAILGFIGKILTVAVMVGAMLAAAGFFFRIEEITVYGNEKYTKAEIVAASGLKDGDSMLLFDKNKVISAIRENHRYLNTVSVQREFPAEIRINVTEYSEDYAMNINGAYWIADSSGVLLDLRTAVLSDAVPINGVVMKEATKGRVFECADFATDMVLKTLLAAIEEAELYDRVTLIDVSQSYRSVVTIDNKFDFVFGDVGTIRDAVMKIDSLVNYAREDGAEYGTYDVSESTIRFLPRRVDDGVG